MVTVHRVVAADDGRDPVGRERVEVRRARLGRDVAAVGERMDPRRLGHPGARRDIEKRAEMIDVRVDAAGRHEAEQMHRPTPRPGAAERAGERIVLEERSVLDRATHADEILVEDPTRADRQVTDLGVPHLPVGQPDGGPGRGQLRTRERRHETVEDRRVRELDRVPGPRRSDAPPVEHDEGDERPLRDAHAVAARQIAANDSGSSDAPPTSAPSIAGWAISSSAFSGLTEPP